MRELKAGAQLLRMELEIVRPRMILILGGSAKKAFLQIDDTAVTKTLRTMATHTFEKITTGMGFETVIGLSFHPSPLVFNMAHKRECLLQFFAKLQQQEL
jgi:DNA polymerase